MRAAIEHNRALPLTDAAVRAIQQRLGAEVDGAWGPETTSKLQTWQRWRLEQPEGLPASCHGYLEADGTFGPYTQYALGIDTPLALQRRGSDKWARPDRTRVVYRMAERYGLVLAIDLYRGNPEPNWRQLYTLGFRVYLPKLGEIYRNDVEYALDRMLRARGAGYLLGGYHWFRDESNPARQARALERMLVSAPRLDIPIGMDFERDYAPHDPPPELRAKGNAFVEALDAPLLLYGGLHFMRSDLDIDKPQPGPLDDLPRWVARYPHAIDRGAEALWAKRPPDPWSIWQLTSSGAHPSLVEDGLLARVDLNVCKPDELERLQRLQRGEDCA